MIHIILYNPTNPHLHKQKPKLLFKQRSTSPQMASDDDSSFRVYPAGICLIAITNQLSARQRPLNSVYLISQEVSLGDNESHAV